MLYAEDGLDPSLPGLTFTLFFIDPPSLASQSYIDTLGEFHKMEEVEMPKLHHYANMAPLFP
jgi:hypothetical protein